MPVVDFNHHTLALAAAGQQALDPAVGGVLVQGCKLHVYSPEDATLDAVEVAHKLVADHWIAKLQRQARLEAAQTEVSGRYARARSAKSRVRLSLDFKELSRELKEAVVEVASCKARLEQLEQAMEIMESK